MKEVLKWKKVRKEKIEENKIKVCDVHRSKRDKSVKNEQNKQQLCPL